jgi:hypothetical protein
MKLLRSVAVAGILFGAAGCRQSLAPTSSTEIGANLVRLTVSASSTQVIRGFPVTIHITLVNQGTETVTLHFRDSCQINPYIHNSAGEVVLPGGGGYICATVLTDLTLAPGDTVARDFVWTGSTTFASAMPLRPLPPGKYVFTAQVPADEATLRASVEITLK